MSEPPEDDDYEVGYGRPPKATRFPKGQSGNPAGRPKGARNRKPRNWEERLIDLIRAESEREVTVRENGEPVTMTAAKAVVRSINFSAVKGNVRAQALFLELVRSAAAEDGRRKTALMDALIAYKREWQNVFDDCDRAGKTRPDVALDPNDIVIDEETGEPAYVGVLRGWQSADDRERIREHEAELRFWQKELEATDDPEERASIEMDVARQKEVLGILRQMAGMKPKKKPEDPAI